MLITMWDTKFKSTNTDNCANKCNDGKYLVSTSECVDYDSPATTPSNWHFKFLFEDSD